MPRTITRKQFETEAANLAKELAEARQQLDHYQGNLGIPNRIRDAEIETWETRIRWIEKDRDELWDANIKG